VKRIIFWYPDKLQGTVRKYEVRWIAMQAVTIRIVYAKIMSINSSFLRLQKVKQATVFLRHSV